MAQKRGPSVFPIALPTVLGDALRAVPEYCWLSRLVSGMGPNRGPSVFPIALPTVLGDTLSVRKIFVRNSGAGNGCANFMDAWKNALFLQEKPCP